MFGRIYFCDTADYKSITNLRYDKGIFTHFQSRPRKRVWKLDSRAEVEQAVGMKSIAIIGASNDRNKFGNKAVRAFLRQGYKVFPVNLKSREIEGLSTFRTI